MPANPFSAIVVIRGQCSLIYMTGQLLSEANSMRNLPG
jgi:hypothetical protein